MVTISCVRTDKQLRAFIKFPEKLYKDHPYWVPPLRMDEMNCLKKTAPAFRHCDAEYFLAYKGDEIVGRVAAIINTVAKLDYMPLGGERSGSKAGYKQGYYSDYEGAHRVSYTIPSEESLEYTFIGKQQNGKIMYDKDLGMLTAFI